MIQSKNFMEEDERFPELHDLLNSYAFAGNTFTDSVQEPGPALQAYVRQAVRKPDLLDQVIAEIDDLLEIGLFSDEIADDVEILPHVEPPTGSTVEQCLAVIRSHLERIKNGGAYQRSALPQTDWEWRKQFPELRHLLAAHFHQDFSRFYSSHGKALEDYLDGNPVDDLAEATREIDSFLSLIDSDSELNRAAQILGLMVYPPDGLSLRQWLIDMQGAITDHLRSGAS
ncbi:contact-dependent growth inhibition system immunity protein [Streptomyces sp. NPDC001178]